MTQKGGSHRPKTAPRKRTMRNVLLRCRARASHSDKITVPRLQTVADVPNHRWRKRIFRGPAALKAAWSQPSPAADTAPAAPNKTQNRTIDDGVRSLRHT